jgi:hypothetical protein
LCFYSQIILINMLKYFLKFFRLALGLFMGYYGLLWIIIDYYRLLWLLNFIITLSFTTLCLGDCLYRSTYRQLTSLNDKW